MRLAALALRFAEGDLLFGLPKKKAKMRVKRNGVSLHNLFL